MNASLMNEAGQRPRLRVSIITRIVAALIYTIPAIGGALSSLLLMNLFRELKNSENAGIVTVMTGMKQAAYPAIVSLYLAALCGIVLIVVLVVRMFVQTKTASPPFWFFALGGVLTLLPAVFFWKAQMLIVEALSPGSSGLGGIGAVGANISMLLMLSIVVAPIVFIVLIAASVIPFSSRPGRKWGSLAITAMIEIMLIAVAIAVPFLIDGPKRKNEIVNLPANVRSADEDQHLDRPTSAVITMTADGKLYKRQGGDLPGGTEKTEEIVTKEEIPAYITTTLENKTPDNRIVYFKCESDASYDSILQIFDGIRKADVDRVGLAVTREKNVNDPYQIAPLIFEVHLPEQVDKTVEVRPNPLTLVVAMDKDGRLSLNNDQMGAIPDTKKLENKLSDIFKARENNGVFREGSNEIEKTVFLKVSKSRKYGDFIKVVDALKVSGTEPIGVQIDEIDQ